MMQAQVLHSPVDVDDGPLRLERVAIPVPRDRQIRIRVACCGVCLTDKHICEGELLPKKPLLIPGHQIVGRVDALGENVRTFSLGERVGGVWLGQTCGQCLYCLQNRENLCFEAQFTGWDTDGGYAEYVLIQEGFVHRLPAILDDQHIAPLLCAGVIGYRSLVKSCAGKGSRLGLYGFGNSAHIVTQIAHHIGSVVYAFARSPHHRQLALDLGAHWVGNIGDTPPEKLDQIIVFAPSGEVVSTALMQLARGGNLIINAIHMSDIPSIAYEHLFYERTVCSVSHGTRRDVEGLFSLLKDCSIHTEVETFTLNQANQALAKQKHSAIKAAGVIVI